MCVIMDKPAGTDMPDKSVIERMFDRNNHGAGFAVQGWFKHYDKQGKPHSYFDVLYFKGFMTKESLLEGLGDFEKLKNYRVVIHCRIKTHGETDPYTTHPFPVSDNFHKLRSLSGRNTPVVFHNGVFSGLGGLIDPKASDTQDFAAGVAFNLLKDPYKLTPLNKKIAEEIAGTCRVLILYPNPKVQDFRLGTWIEDMGCKFSNASYEAYESLPAKSGAHYGAPWDDEDDYYDIRYGRSYGRATREEPWKGKATFLNSYGCEEGEFASPSSKLVHWIDLHTKERMDEIKNRASYTEEVPNGSTLYYFHGNEAPWIINEDALIMYDEEGEKLYENWLDELAEEEEAEELENNYIQFGSIDEVLEWEELVTAYADGTYADAAGKTWYLDWESLEAYTDKGIALMFPTGEQGHVKRALKLHGYNNYSGVYADRTYEEWKKKQEEKETKAQAKLAEQVKKEFNEDVNKAVKETIEWTKTQKGKNANNSNSTGKEISHRTAAREVHGHYRGRVQDSLRNPATDSGVRGVIPTVGRKDY